MNRCSQSLPKLSVWVVSRRSAASPGKSQCQFRLSYLRSHCHHHAYSRSPLQIDNHIVKRMRFVSTRSLQTRLHRSGWRKSSWILRCALLMGSCYKKGAPSHVISCATWTIRVVKRNVWLLSLLSTRQKLQDLNERDVHKSSTRESPWVVSLVSRGGS